MQKRIAVLGAGNIGFPIAEGIQASEITNQKVIITRKKATFSKKEKDKFKCLKDNQEAVSYSNIVVLAVQPKQADEVLSEIKDFLSEKHLLISVVSGLGIEQIENLLQKKIPVARAMPNTAIRVCQSMTCLAFSDEGKKHQELVEDIFNRVGTSLLIPENLFTAATVLCGSGSALGLKYIRGYMQACIQHGFNEFEALMIATQVLKGATMMLDGKHPETEIDKVTTPGGCTIAALTEMEHAGFSSALLKAIEVAVEKAKKLY